MSSQQKLSQQEVSPISTAAPAQGDNVAHALAGAGGGLLSMTLTLAPSFQSTSAEKETHFIALGIL